MPLINIKTDKNLGLLKANVKSLVGFLADAWGKNPAVIRTIITKSDTPSVDVFALGQQPGDNVERLKDFISSLEDLRDSSVDYTGIARTDWFRANVDMGTAIAMKKSEAGYTQPEVGFQKQIRGN